MKNRLLILALLIVSSFADASQLTIDHPCLIKPILSLSTSIDSSTEDLFSFTKKQITDQNIVAVLANNGIIFMPDQIKLTNQLWTCQKKP